MRAVLFYLIVLTLCSALGCARGDDDDAIGRDTGGGTRDSGMDARDTGGGGVDSGRVDTGGGVDTGPADTGMAGPCDGVADGTSCDVDGDGCTMDLCRRGMCVIGGAVDCGTGPCAPSCVSTGPTTYMCVGDTSPQCLVEGECVAALTTEPDNVCGVCDPARNANGWSNRDGGCDDGDSCTTGDTCADRGCVGTPTRDEFEPNEDIGSAHNLGSVSDGDSYPAGTTAASLFPTGDADVFVFNDSDDFGSFIFPKAELFNIPSGSNYDLCAVIRCESSYREHSCTMGAVETVMGMPACCSRAGSNADEAVRINHDCSGSDDSADIFLIVSKVSGEPTCDDYRLRYGDD